VTHKDLKEGDIICDRTVWGSVRYRVLKISRSWFRRRRAFLVSQYAHDNLVHWRDVPEGTKLWCSAEEIDGTLNLPRAFVQRDGKQVEREDV
jgi:hypothetical protein